MRRISVGSIGLHLFQNAMTKTQKMVHNITLGTCVYYASEIERERVKERADNHNVIAN